MPLSNTPWLVPQLPKGLCQYDKVQMELKLVFDWCCNKNDEKCRKTCEIIIHSRTIRREADCAWAWNSQKHYRRKGAKKHTRFCNSSAIYPRAEKKTEKKNISTCILEKLPQSWAWFNEALNGIYIQYSATIPPTVTLIGHNLKRLNSRSTQLLKWKHLKLR